MLLGAVLTSGVAGGIDLGDGGFVHGTPAAIDSTQPKASGDTQNEPPTVRIEVDPEIPNASQRVAINGTESSDPDGEIVEYVWRIDGKFVATAPEFTYVFEEAGRHDVSLTVTDDDGQTTTGTIQVDVLPNSPPRVAIDYSPIAPNVSEAVSFTANVSDSEGEVERYRWWIDGELAATTPSFSHTFETAGDHEIELNVTDNGGAWNNTTITLEVGENRPPIAAIDYQPSQPNVSEPVRFSANDSRDPNGQIESYEWRIDGVVVSTAPSFTHVFETGGQYLLTLRLTDDDGGTTRESVTVAVIPNTPPQAAISFEPPHPNINQPVNFTASASDPDGSIETTVWVVDGTVVSTARSVSVSFETPGEHQVTLRVTDDDGETVNVTETLAVNAPPTVSLESRNPTLGEPITLMADATDPDGEITGYVWRIDDQVVGRSPSVEYTFEEAGSHQVEVEVTDDDGASARAVASVTVRTPTPTTDGETTTRVTTTPSTIVFSPGQPGFGFLVALFWLIAVFALWFRRLSD